MSEHRIDAPSAWRLEKAMSSWHAARANLIANDPSLNDDEAALIELLGEEDADVRGLLARLIRGAVHARDMAAAAATRAAEIEARGTRYTERAKKLAAVALDIMRVTGEMRVELPDALAVVARGRPSVFIMTEDIIPDRFWRTGQPTRAIDKVAIGKALAAGEEVPGAVIAPGNDNLQIRTR